MVPNQHDPQSMQTPFHDILLSCHRGYHIIYLHQHMCLALLDTYHAKIALFFNLFSQFEANPQMLRIDDDCLIISN